MYCVAFQGQRDRDPQHWYICVTYKDCVKDFTTDYEWEAEVFLQEMRKFHAEVDYKIMNYETVKMLNELTGDF